MTNLPGRLLLAGVCCLAFAVAAPAQSGGLVGDDAEETAHPSHRLLDTDIGDLAGAEEQLARRLHHAQDIQQLQDLVKSMLGDADFKNKLQQEFKDLKPAQIDELKQTIQNKPELLDDPKLRDALKSVENLKNQNNVNSLPPETRDSVAKWAKEVIDKQKPPDPASSDPMTAGSTNPTPPQPTEIAPPKSPDRPAIKPQPPPAASKPSGWRHELLRGLSGLAKDINGTPEGEALRTEALRDLARLESDSSGSSGGLTDLLKGVLSLDQTGGLSQRWKTSFDSGLGGWNSNGVASALPSVGGSSGGLMDAVLWIAALALLIAAGWMAVAVARRQAGRARARAWSAGPWPVRPSQVSTRQDLIRAFEHLAYLLLGPAARSLNHLDVADRLGRKEAGRADAAHRLAHLYEQARYAPPDEALPDHELTAARGDLAALAGAAA